MPPPDHLRSRFRSELRSNELYILFALVKMCYKMLGLLHCKDMYGWSPLEHLMGSSGREQSSQVATSEDCVCLMVFCWMAPSG